ncbi:polysaccharide pyruvyl transferase family protein [Pleomorphovibrio marinus]|uniref:polysaccharide pyruvyl transferase family protein n=1 Tax=Pleomorphovibrio marinus TaxID=2164132 RepID=UPI000E0A3938|nr:polysaccharide pyruvyl transferase family protein [Pleomorphovibrio marinus]
MRVLLAGWFSFENMGTTAGDVLACNIVSNWLTELKIPFHIASNQDELPGLEWQKVSENNYTHLIFICGPFGNGWPVNTMLEKFKNAHLLGINLSLLQSLKDWNPFDFLLERDSDRRNLPDITFGSESISAPLVGLIKAHKQKEYGAKAMHELVHEQIDLFISREKLAVVNIDTSLENNAFGLNSSLAVESLISKMDIIITTRLHGMVLGLKNEVPVIAIDPIDGGAKISSQAKAIGWPYILSVTDTNQKSLSLAFDNCTQQSIRSTIKRSKEMAKKGVNEMKDELEKYFLNSKNNG